MRDDSILVRNITTGTEYRARKEVSYPAGIEVIMYRLDTNEAYMPHEFFARYIQIPEMSAMTQERQR